MRRTAPDKIHAPKALESGEEQVSQVSLLLQHMYKPLGDGIIQYRQKNIFLRDMQQKLQRKTADIQGVILLYIQHSYAAPDFAIGCW